jgi:hypothetical protein
MRRRDQPNGMQSGDRDKPTEDCLGIVHWELMVPKVGKMTRRLHRFAQVGKQVDTTLVVQAMQQIWSIQLFHRHIRSLP